MGSWIDDRCSLPYTWVEGYREVGWKGVAGGNPCWKAIEAIFGKMTLGK